VILNAEFMKFLRNIVYLIILNLVIPETTWSQTARDSVIDGLVAVVGGNIILKSDIEGQYFQIRSQGNILRPEVPDPRRSPCSKADPAPGPGRQCQGYRRHGGGGDGPEDALLYLAGRVT
jgi:hypothetical protein